MLFVHRKTAGFIFYLYADIQVENECRLWVEEYIIGNAYNGANTNERYSRISRR